MLPDRMQIKSGFYFCGKSGMINVTCDFEGMSVRKTDWNDAIKNTIKGWQYGITDKKSRING